MLKLEFVWCLFHSYGHDSVPCVTSAVKIGFDNILFCWKGNIKHYIIIQFFSFQRIELEFTSIT